MATGNDQALGRSWKANARMVVMESEVGDVIRHKGWAVWAGADFHQTCYYAEYNNMVPNGDPRPRAEWVKMHVQIDKKEVSLFLIRNWLGDVVAKFIVGFIKS